MELFIRSVIDTKPWDKDSNAVAFPWRSDVANAKPLKFRIGYYCEDPEYPVHPPVRRALESAAKVLAAAGHEVIPLEKTPSLKKAADLCTDFW